MVRKSGVENRRQKMEVDLWYRFPEHGSLDTITKQLLIYQYHVVRYHVRQRLHEVDAFSRDLYQSVNVTWKNCLFQILTTILNVSTRHNRITTFLILGTNEHFLLIPNITIHQYCTASKAPVLYYIHHYSILCWQYQLEFTTYKKHVKIKTNCFTTLDSEHRYPQHSSNHESTLLICYLTASHSDLVVNKPSCNVWDHSIKYHQRQWTVYSDNFMHMLHIVTAMPRSTLSSTDTQHNEY